MPINNIKTLETSFGEFKLSRYPSNSPNTLQAWDSADRQLIEAAKHYLEERFPIKPETVDTTKNDITLQVGKKPIVWVINDNFGAITTALHHYQPWHISDSSIAHAACRLNHQLNDLTVEENKLITSLQWPTASPDLILFKIPKTRSYWEYQLTSLKPLLTEETHFLGAAMAKHLPKSMVALINQIIGNAQPSLAVKKARLIRCEINHEQVPIQTKELSRYEVKEFGLTLVNHPNLFSRERLDIGTRFLLEHLPRYFQSLTDKSSHIIDMACGNGAIGIWAGNHNPQAKITFADESYMAIASAKLNAGEQLNNAETAFIATNCLESLENDSADVILNNPPFHQQHVVGDFIAQNMFKDAYRVLRKGGEIWVVANRQLGYHIALKRLFGHCETVTGNPKFVILKAVKNG